MRPRATLNYLTWLAGWTAIVGTLLFASLITGWLAAFLLLWFLLFLFLREDFGAWPWPPGDERALAFAVRTAILAGITAAVPCAVGWWILGR